MAKDLNADASRMPECPNLNALLRIRSGYQVRTPGLLLREPLATNSAVRNQMFHMWAIIVSPGISRDARTLRDRVQSNPETEPQ